MNTFTDNIDYADINKLKQCYKAHIYLRCRAEKGEINAADLMIDLDRGLNALNDEERLTITYRYYKDYSIRGTAEIVGKSAQWVRSREERALHKISHYLLTGLILSTSQAKQEIKEKKKDE